MTAPPSPSAPRPRPQARVKESPPSTPKVRAACKTNVQTVVTWSTLYILEEIIRECWGVEVCTALQRGLFRRRDASPHQPHTILTSPYRATVDTNVQ